MTETAFPRGSYVLVRSHKAGVHAGQLMAIEGNSVVLAHARRLWQWRCAKGAFLSGVARHGIDYSASKIGGPIEMQWVGGVCEILATSSTAAQSIATAPEHLA